MFILYLFWLAGVAARYLVGFAIDKKVSVADNTAMAVVSGVIGLIPAYILTKVGAHGAAANVVMIILGFLSHFGLIKLFHIKNQAA